MRVTLCGNGTARTEHDVAIWQAVVAFVTTVDQAAVAECFCVEDLGCVSNDTIQYTKIAQRFHLHPNDLFSAEFGWMTIRGEAVDQSNAIALSVKDHRRN